MNRVRALWLDATEQILILAFYGSLVLRIVNGIRHGNALANALLLPSEGLVLVFILLRHRTDRLSSRPAEWLIALAATALPLFVRVGSRPSPIPTWLCAFLIVFGMLIQLHAKVCLGRSFGCVPANRGLTQSGPYKFVRHPMYAGYMLSDVGFLAMNPTWWNLTIYGISQSLQVARILAEERFLSQDEAYRRYQAAVPYRLFPGIF
jgi:protein-S-isoprenylcysteine O-methyltransferase Ste14